MSEQFNNPHPPMPGQPHSGPATAGPAPAPVETAFKLMLARAALSLLSLLALFATKDALREQIEKSNTGTTDIDTVVNAALTIGVVFGLLFTVLYVALAFQVRKGKSWARIVTFVLAGLSILSGLASLAQPVPAISRILGLLVLIVDIAIVVMLVNKKSGEFFHRR